jgi:non-canonical (house-cleaning) NTP pyrophosphatase
VLVIVASLSEIKVEAVRAVARTRHQGAEVRGVKAASGVAEQPVGAETLCGAMNRLEAARRCVAIADVYVSIENGISCVRGRWYDEAVAVAVDSKGFMVCARSEQVSLPLEAVLRAQQVGFDTCTVGMALADMGFVARHDDPHYDLVGRHRADILRDLVEVLLGQIWDQSAMRNDSGVATSLLGEEDAPRF